MSKILYLALLLFVGCQNVNSQESNTASNKEVQARTKSVLVESDRDPETGHIIAKTRSASQIDSTYPYNITIKDADGNDHNSSDTFKKNDKPTVILFWLTTCYPCGMEMKAISEKYSDWIAETDFNFYAISTDWTKNEKQFIKRVKEKNWPWETYWDFNKEFRNVMPGKLNGLPQVFLLDKNGEIVFHKRKYTTGDEDKLYEKIKEYASK